MYSGMYGVLNECGRLCRSVSGRHNWPAEANQQRPVGLVDCPLAPDASAVRVAFSVHRLPGSGGLLLTVPGGMSDNTGYDRAQHGDNVVASWARKAGSVPSDGIISPL